MSDYDSIEDPYCYRGTQVLKNRLGIRDADALSAFEAEMAAQRALEPLPAGRLTVSHLKAVHRHLFGDVYPWAGQFRKVRISKGGSMFCYPENIDAQMACLFSTRRHDFWGRMRCVDEFVEEVATFLSDLNAIHPFREGNGRTQLSFIRLIAERQGHALHFERLDADAFLRAMIESFAQGAAPVAVQLRRLIS